MNTAWSCVECFECHGTGYVDVPPLQEGGWISVEKCPSCGGTGEQKRYNKMRWGGRPDGTYESDRS